jgi:protein-S-isoprenylcysteine O-methyltransferase Ste14
MLLFLKNLVFTVLVPGTVAVWVPYRLVSRAPSGFSIELGRLLLAVPAFAFGAAVYFSCLWAFGTTGRGTPAPIDPPKQLVARGLYRHLRNPMYVGVLLVIAGWALLSGSWGVVEYGAVVAVCFHLFVVLVEEPLLLRRFGDSYEEYRRAVPRWVPRRPWARGEP